MHRALIMMILLSSGVSGHPAGACEPLPRQGGAQEKSDPTPFTLTLYGRGDLKASYNHAPREIHTITYGLWNGSRLGVKGRGETRLGLAPIFHLESGFGTESGKFRFMQQKFLGRQAYAGVESGLGTVTVGRQYPVSDAVADLVDIALPGFLSAYKSQFYWQIDRLERSVIYSTPKGGGWQGRLGYAFGKESGEPGSSTVTGGVLYGAGPLKAGAALESWRTSAFGSSNTFYNFWNLAASYESGGTTLVAGFSSDGVNMDLSSESTVASRTYAAGATVAAGAAGKAVLLQQVVHPDRGRVIAISTVRYTHQLSRGASLYAQVTVANHEAVNAYRRRGEFIMGVHYRFEVSVPAE